MMALPATLPCAQRERRVFEDPGSAPAPDQVSAVLAGGFLGSLALWIDAR